MSWRGWRNGDGREEEDCTILGIFPLAMRVGFLGCGIALRWRLDGLMPFLGL